MRISESIYFECAIENEIYKKKHNFLKDLLNVNFIYISFNWKVNLFNISGYFLTTPRG